MWRRRQPHSEDTVRAAAVQAAIVLAHHLQNGNDLAPVQVTDIPLAESEIAYADVTCSIARFYESDVVYPRPAGYFEDHPSFGRRWVMNHLLDARQRQQAETAAQPQWRDHTPARVVLTSTGVRLRPSRSPTWMPFDHALLSRVSAGEPEVVLSYTVCAPLLLSGQAAPWLGVAIEHLRNSAP